MRAHHLGSQTTTNLRTLVTAVCRAISSANANDTAVFLYVSSSNPERALEDVLYRTRGVLVLAVYDANHRPLIDGVHVSVLCGNVPTQQLLFQLMKLYGPDLGSVWGAGIGHDEGDILLDTNDATDFRAFEHRQIVQSVLTNRVDALRGFFAIGEIVHEDLELFVTHRREDVRYVAFHLHHHTNHALVLAVQHAHGGTSLEVLSQLFGLETSVTRSALYATD